MSTTEFVALLGRWDEHDGPLYVQLSRALRRLVESGQLPAGTVLPPERRLAKVLSVSRNTVTAAYSQLRRDGWIDARQGAQTKVVEAGYSNVAAHKANGLFTTLLREHPDVLDLTVAVPAAAPPVLSRLERPLDLSVVAEGHGYFPHGYPPLRSAMADILSRNGLPTADDELIITSGAQQAIALAVSGFVSAGDSVLVEEFTFPGALDAIAIRRAHASGVRLHSDGVDVQELQRQIAEVSPALVYLIPTFNNPTGAVVRGAARSHLARVLAESGTPAIDDLTLSELDYGEPAPPPLAALEPDAPIISVGSMSKVFWGGLRIGWLRAHPNIIDRLAGLKAFADMGTSAPTQAIALQLLEHYDATREWRKGQLAASLEAFDRSAKKRLRGWSWRLPEGGPHIWLGLPDGDATSFSHFALRHGLALVSGSLLAAAEIESGHIRLPLYRSPDELA